MDPRLLKYYNRELQHLREMGGEFAAEYPKIAGRLSLDGFECADPYVERLLEGFSFLAARVQLKIDAEFPGFTRHLFEAVYPHYLCPTPSMAVVRLQPDLTEGSLADGFLVPRGSVLQSVTGKGDQTACEYRTAHDLKLWPIEISEAEYFTYPAAASSLEIPDLPGVKAGIRLRLRATAGLTFNKISLDALLLFLRGSGELPMHLYEQMQGNAAAIVVRPARRPAPWREVLDKSRIARVGFEDEQSLLPYGFRSFQGYRILHEYFACPQRFMFVEIGGLAEALGRCTDGEIDILVLFDRTNPVLENAVDATHFSLHCTPAINLFPKRADRIHLSEQEENHVVPDRTRPMDFEVYEVTEVVGYGTSTEERQDFLPFYASSEHAVRSPHLAYFTVQRVPRVPSSRQRAQGSRTSYIGSEVFVSLVDGNEAPYSSNLRQLAVSTLCTNRDLPMLMPVGSGATDFTLEASGPVQSVRCLAGPTKPVASHAYGETAWRLISHLSLNYLTLLDSDERQGAAALRDLLSLYGEIGEPPVRKQIEGVRSVAGKPVVRRLPTPGPISFGRGMEVDVTMDEASFEGTGVFLLGAVLEQFFAKYVSINSFTETVIQTVDRGEIVRWPARPGRRHLL